MKNKNKLLFVIFISILMSNISSSAQNFLWAKQMGGTNVEVGNAVTTDAAGNVYTAGYFQGTADFDPGFGIFNLTSSGTADIFVTKFNSTGNFIWAIQMGSNASGTGSNQATGIAIDPLGNIVIAGYFNGVCDFDPGPGTYYLGAALSTRIFIVKIDPLGNLIWAKNVENTSSNLCNSLFVDNNGYIYTTGYFGNTSDFDPGPGVFNLVSTGSADAFVLKLDSNGNFVWAKQLGGASIINGTGISSDNLGNVLVTGYFQGTADFDPSASNYDLTSFGSNDIFVSKLDSNGNFVWAKQMGGTGDDWGLSVTTDLIGNIITTGYFRATADFDPSATVLNLTASVADDAFISKLDGSGNLIWVKQFGGTSTERGYSVKTDNINNIYTTGYFAGTTDFDPNAGVYDLTSNGGVDTFISKLDSTGNFVWAKSFGGTGTDRPYAIHVDLAKNVYTTGQFQNTVDFDTDAGIYNITSFGTFDIFVHKMNQCSASSSSMTVNSCDSYLSPSGNTYTVSGIYNDTILNVSSCDSIITINLTISTIDNSITQTGNVLSSNEAGATYQWLDCNTGFSVISGETSQSYVATINGNYAVIISNGICVDTSNCINVLISNINSVAAKNKTHIFPNPTNGIVNILFEENTESEVSVYNSLGEIMIQEYNKNKIDLSNFKNGVYFISIKSKNFFSIEKLIKID